MALKTQATELYLIDPEDGSLITVGCVTSIDGIDTTVEQIETTCLSDSARTYVAGLGTPGTMTFGINFDPSDASHVRLHAIKVLGLTATWAVGMSDGTADPSPSTSGDFDFADLPTSRSWIKFDGYMNSFPFSIQQNAVIASSVGIQISGEPTLSPKV